MIRRPITIALAAASLGLIPCPAFAQGPASATPEAGNAPVPAPRHEAKSKNARAGHPAKPSADHRVGAAAAVPAPVAGGETEAASLERRRRAFFGAKPDEAAPGQDTPSAGVTLGGSGGISPGMGFKF